MPDPVDPDDIGSTEFAKQMNKGAWLNVANPWDEEEIIAAAVEDYDAPDLQPNREQVQKMTRGFQYKMCNYNGKLSSGITYQCQGGGGHITLGGSLVA